MSVKTLLALLLSAAALVTAPLALWWLAVSAVAPVDADPFTAGVQTGLAK